MFNKKRIKNFGRANSNKEVSSKLRPDYSILIVAMFLTLFGILMIFSSSAFLAFQNKDFNNDLFYIFNRHLIWIVIGVTCAIVIYKTKIDFLRKLSVLAIITLIFLMIYMLPEALSSVTDPISGLKTIEMPLVKTLNSGTRWIDLGIFDMQPAEFIKIPIIIFSAYWFNLNEKAKKGVEEFLNKFKKQEFLHLILSTILFFLPFVLLGLIVFLVLAQKDLDSAIVIAIPIFAIYFAASTRKQQVYTLVGILAIGVIGGLMLISSQDYRQGRFDAYLEIILTGDPSNETKTRNGFQVWNGLIAIGSGGVFGRGYNESRQKFYYLQEAAYTDSIFAVTAEEFGLIGSLIIMLSFLYLGARGFKNAASSTNKFHSLIMIGVTSWIVSQAFLNIAANLSLIPFAGMPLPFFSYGGSNTLMICLGIGLLLNLSRKEVKPERVNPLIRNIK